MSLGHHLASLALTILPLTLAAKSASEVFALASPSVVVVRTADGQAKPLMQGSGVALPGQTVATNCHVVAKAAWIGVADGGELHPAAVVYANEDRDVCLLQVQGLTAPPARLGSSIALRVGAPVYAIGTPRGLELTLSEGIVSSFRSVGGGRLIQTTAPISPGSSGGGLFDAKGQLVGLPSFMLRESQQLNFAVPVEWVKTGMSLTALSPPPRQNPPAGRSEPPSTARRAIPQPQPVSPTVKPVTGPALKSTKACEECPEMVRLPDGEFLMGSPESEPDRHSNERQHWVTVGSFAIGKYEVTQAEWRAVMGINPSYHAGCDRCPVEMVSWDEVQDYLKKLNARTGKRYRLPTEAEWEYACRAGGRQRYCGADRPDPVAWYEANTAGNVGWGRTHPVGQKQPNAFGLYDMSGNVEESTCSAYDAEYSGGEMLCANDPGSPHAPRGGSSWGQPDDVRSAIRGDSTFRIIKHSNITFIPVPGSGAGDLGFRLALGSVDTSSQPYQG